MYTLKNTQFSPAIPVSPCCFILIFERRSARRVTRFRRVLLRLFLREKNTRTRFREEHIRKAHKKPGRLPGLYLIPRACTVVFVVRDDCVRGNIAGERYVENVAQDATP